MPHTGWSLNSCWLCGEQLAPDDFDGVCSDCDFMEDAPLDTELVKSLIRLQIGIAKTLRHRMLSVDSIYRNTRQNFPGINLLYGDFMNVVDAMHGELNIPKESKYIRVDV